MYCVASEHFSFGLEQCSCAVDLERWNVPGQIVGTFVDRGSSSRRCARGRMLVVMYLVHYFLY